jgi:hypothetical protein
LKLPHDGAENSKIGRDPSSDAPQSGAFLLTKGFARWVHIHLTHGTRLVQPKFQVNSRARGTNQLASQGAALIFPSSRKIRPLLALLLALLTVCAAARPALAQEKKVAQKNGVDISKMGAYRALAQHIYTEFQRGDVSAAAELGTVLERVWDKAEEYGGDTALAKTNRQLFDEIDRAMDQFITPITDAKGKPPDAAKVKAAYNAYLEKLKLAD